MTDQIKQIQTLVGTTADGIIGPKTLSALCTKLGVDYELTESKAWKNIQSKVRTTPDGIFGPKTAAAVITALNGSAPSSNGKLKKIIIDIGHVNNSGSRGVDGWEEHASNVIVAKHLEQQLKAKGIEVIVIDFPDMANDPEITKVRNTANSIGADLLISLHHDASSTSSPKGGHVIYYRDSSKKYASAVAAVIAKRMPGRADTVVQRSNLGILKVNMDAILVESGFITNEYDNDIQRNHPELIAQDIVTGLNQYL